MPTKRSPGYSLIVIAVAVCSLVQAPAADSPARPRIIFVLADDLGSGDVGCYGGTVAPTPNLDRMAQAGIRFTQYYSAAPICSPSRAGLITGQSPARWRITSYLQTREGNRGCEQADFLDPSAPSLPRALQAAGYKTAHFGKWHLGGGRDVTNAPSFANYGYDDHAGTWESPQPHPDVTGADWVWSPKDKVKRWERSAFYVDRTLEFLTKNRAQPCFVNLWLDDPHTPWVPRSDAPKGDTMDNLRDVLVEMDRQVGRLLDGVRERGLDRNTLIVFTSDNGALPTFKGLRSASFRGSKLSLYEGGVRVPFISMWPGHIPADRVDQETVLSALDIFPTFCALAGALLPDSAALDGENMAAALTGKPAVRRKPLLWEYGRNDTFFKFPGNQRDRSPAMAVREGVWKLLVNADGGGEQLYNVEIDSAEKTNVAGMQPELLQSLKAKVLGWRGSWLR